MRILEISSTLLVLLLPAYVHAAQSGRLQVKLDSQGVLEACEAGEPAVGSDGQQSLVAATVGGAKPAQDLTFKRTDKDLGVLSTSAPRVLLIAPDLSGEIVVEAQGKSVRCTVPAPAADQKPNVAEATDPKVIEDQLVTAGREYLKSAKITDHVREGDRLTIYHLPNGEPAFAVPAHLSESVKLRLTAVVPKDYNAEFEVTSCADVPNYRIAGSFADAKTAISTFGAAQSEEMQEVSHTVELRCSGTLTYNVKVTQQGLTVSTRNISIKLDPVYRFSWGVALAFDFGKPPRLSLGDRASESGSEKFIAQDTSLTGVKPLVSLTLHLFEANPYDWRFANWWNLFLALDPTRLADGFAAGLNFKPIPQVGLLVGVSVFKSMTLAKGVKEKPGDIWTATGDLPTDKVFDKHSVGLLLGIELGLDVFTALVK